MRVDHHESVGTEIERANGSVLVLRRRDDGAVGRRGGRAFMIAREQQRDEHRKEGDTTHGNRQEGS
jgi:hypothetical protein